MSGPSKNHKDHSSHCSEDIPNAGTSREFKMTASRLDSLVLAIRNVTFPGRKDENVPGEIMRLVVRECAHAYVAGLSVGYSDGEVARRAD